MRVSPGLCALAGLTTCFAATIKSRCVIKPKVFIISMFDPEANVWYDHAGEPDGIGSLLAQNITVPGFSPLFPDAHCTASGDVCQLTTGESEINAATTIAALVYSNLFDLTTTYFMIAGIAGINPRQGTTGSVAFSKYAVQVALQYEFDAREKPSNWSTGYFGFDTEAPNIYPSSIYGTEVFELNEALRDIAVVLAINGSTSLNDSSTAQAYRAHYSVAHAQELIDNSTESMTPEEGVALLELAVTYAAATEAPSIITCDTATSDVYYSGRLLGEEFEETTKLWTNGSGVYCMTAQEDNASLEVLLRAATTNLTDFSRIILMRTASDFERPYAGNSALNNLVYDEQGGFEPAIQNIYIAGVKVVQGILDGWDATFKAGVPATNYIGDIFATLGGTPDFGPGPTAEPIALEKRGVGRAIKSRRLR